MIGQLVSQRLAPSSFDHASMHAPPLPPPADAGRADRTRAYGMPSLQARQIRASHAAAASTPKARGSIVTLALSHIIGWQRFSNANVSCLSNTHKDAGLIRATILKEVRPSCQRSASLLVP